MSDTKISALTSLPGASVDPAADLLPIVDTSATATKSILVSELAKGMGGAAANSNRNVNLLKRAWRGPCTWWEYYDFQSFEDDSTHNQEMVVTSHLTIAPIRGVVWTVWTNDAGMDSFGSDGTVDVGQPHTPPKPGYTRTIDAASMEVAQFSLLQTLFNGSESVALGPRAIQVSDPMFIGGGAGATLGEIDANTVIYCRTLDHVSAGTKMWQNSIGTFYANALGAAYQMRRDVGATGGTPATDKTLDGNTGGGVTVHTDNTNSCWTPTMIIGGKVDPTTHNLYITGDSINHGTGDVVQSYKYYGWAVRASQTAGLNYYNAAKGAETVQNLAINSQTTRRTSLLNLRVEGERVFTAVLNNAKINDTGGRTLAQIKADLIQWWYHLRAASGDAYIYDTTLTPNSTSTDSWATVGNQTPIGFWSGTDGTANGCDGARLNAWLLDGAPITKATRVAAAVGASGAGISRCGDSWHPLEKVLDLNLAVASAPYSGKFKAGYSDDGTHLNVTGATAAAAAFDFTTVLHSLLVA